MTSRLKKIGFTTAAGLGLFVGAAGITVAASSNDTPAPAPAAVVEPADQAEGPGDTGVDCEDGIDSATGAECDGGPAAALADEATEAPEAPDAEEDAAEPSGDPAGLVQAPTPAPDSETETPEAEGTEVETDADGDEAEGDEADDGVDHQFEGEEVGENGNGIVDADDLNGTEVDD